MSLVRMGDAWVLPAGTKTALVKAGMVRTQAFPALTWVVRGALPAGNDAWWCKERDAGKEVVVSGDRLRDMPLAEDFEVVV